VACYRPGDRPHLYYTLRVHRRRKGEPNAFTWGDYRDLILAAHMDNLNIHMAPELADFAAENEEWLRIYQLPAYTPDLNPTEASGRCSSGPWPTSPPPTRSAWSDHQAQAEEDSVPAHLLNGCLAATSLKLEPW
jgi:DDE superfamily endonuclease